MFLFRNLSVFVSIGLLVSSCATHDKSSPDALIGSGTELQAIALSTPLAPQTLEAKLDELFLSPNYASTHWGVRVETLEGDVVYDLQGGKVFMPASQMKVFTTAAALDLLGPDFQYETRLELHGVQEGTTFKGDVVIVGSGDPTLGAWHGEGVQDSTALLPTWVAAIRAKGIEKIEGRILGDGRVFTEEYINTNWNYGDLPYWYAAGTSGLAMEENAFRCEIIPGKAIGDLATVTINPKTNYVELIVTTKTVASGEPSTADSFNFQTEGNTKFFAGQIPLDKVVKERASVWDGARYAAFLLKEECEREGLLVTGEALNIRTIGALPIDRATEIVLTHKSPAMSEICAVINKVSHNFFADQVIRTLGYKVGTEGSFDEGTRVVKEWLQSRGIPNTEMFQQVDGSGLSTSNRFAPEQATALYRSLYTDERLAKPFLASLSERNEATYTVQAKSGFIGGVRTLGGYLKLPAEKTLVFSMMCNQYPSTAKEASDTQNQALEFLANPVK